MLRIVFQYVSSLRLSETTNKFLVLMIKQLTSKKNLNEAYLQVYRNKGVGGVDGVQVTELKSKLQATGQQLNEQIERGTYQVSAIKGVEIPKSNGKMRLLGIPTVVDRFYQQALHQVLQPIFEPDFRTHSYGFRPKRNAHQALQQSPPSNEWRIMKLPWCFQVPMMYNAF